eukprot:jgi/Tetstr1/463949/TSEL_008754.t1
MSPGVGTERRFPDAVPGDVQVLGRPGGAVWLAGGGAAHSARIDESSVSLTALSASNVVLAGRGLRERVDWIASTPGVGDSNVRAEHVAPESVGTDKVGGVVLGGVGGTAASWLAEGAVLAVPGAGGGGLEGVAALTADTVDGGLRVDGDVRLAGGGALTGEGEVRRSGGGDGRRLLDLRKGAPPAVDSASHDGGAALGWEASDPDGDLRTVAVKYSSSSVTAAGVLASPDDWYEADEGAAEQVFVGEGSTSSPYFPFFRDRAGAFPRPAVLAAGRSYRFERAAGASAAHPFWVAAAGLAVEGSPGRSASSGIQAPGEFLQLDVPVGFSGAIGYQCTEHGFMASAFEVRPATPPLDGDPLASLSGAFDTSGRRGVTAYLAAGDAAGNASADVVAVAIETDLQDPAPAGVAPGSRVASSERTGGAYTAADSALATGDAWMPSPSTADQWIQFDLGAPRWVVGVAVRGRNVEPAQYVRAFRVAVQNDPGDVGGPGQAGWPPDGDPAWQAVDSGLDDTDYSTTVSEVLLATPAYGRYVRVNPSTWRNEIAGSFDVLVG